SAVRLRDFKNARREEDKRGNTFPSLDRVRMRRYFYSERLPTFANVGRGPDRCKSPVFSSTVSGVWLSQQSSWQSLARRPLRLATWNFPAALGRGSSSARPAPAPACSETRAAIWKPGSIHLRFFAIS